MARGGYVLIEVSLRNLLSELSKKGYTVVSREMAHFMIKNDMPGKLFWSVEKFLVDNFDYKPKPHILPSEAAFLSRAVLMLNPSDNITAKDVIRSLYLWESTIDVGTVKLQNGSSTFVLGYDMTVAAAERRAHETKMFVKLLKEDPNAAEAYLGILALKEKA